jgi:putative endonuclease
MYPLMRSIGQRFVYILRSESDPNRHYVGRTANVDDRLDWHNAGPSGLTAHHRPWQVVVSLEFPHEREAVRFEKYLKSGSGRAFTKRHFALGAKRVQRLILTNENEETTDVEQSR